ncbi:hypothetical protein QQ045_010509 [Rhodiola kirilowii]
MEALKVLDAAAHSYMTTFDPKLWSRHAFEFFSRSDTLCSNISECFNAYIKDARELPIISCLETIRLLLMKRFQEKYSGMINYGHGIMPRILRKLDEHTKYSLHLQVSCNGRGRPRKKRIREVDEPVNHNPHRVRRGGIKMKCSNCGKVGHNRTRCKDEPSDPKKAADRAKDAARKKVSRQLKKARLEGPQQVKSNTSPPKNQRIEENLRIHSPCAGKSSFQSSTASERVDHGI